MRNSVIEVESTLTDRYHTTVLGVELELDKPLLDEDE